jgi:hypothetical protein
VGVADLPGAAPVMAPVGIALSTNCYLIWVQRGPDDRKECRRWLQQALHAVEAELQRELARRYGQLRDALSAIAADAVDHGVLLV